MDTEKSKELWDRLDNEPERAHRAFQTFLSLPSDERTIVEAYRDHVGNPEAVKPSDTWTRWSREFAWAERASAYDDHLMNVRREAYERGIEEEAERQGVLAERNRNRFNELMTAGQRVELVSSAEALSEQLSSPPVALESLSEHPFFREFWASPDRIGYWVGHPDPPGEDAVAVARRQLAFATSLPDVREDRSVRYILSTHSPVLRAISLCYLGQDLGEPGYLEPVDLILPGEGPPELRFRSLRTSLPDTRVVRGVPG